MHVCPAFTSRPHMIRRAATLTSADGHTTTGLFPPSSSVTGHRCFAAAAMTIRATVPLPVYITWSNRSASTAVVSATPPVATATSSGEKYLGICSASTADVAAATSLGLISTVLPAASAPTSPVSVSWIG